MSDPAQPKVPQSDRADGQWHRVHPLTPLVSSWQMFVVGLVLIGQSFGQQALQGDPLGPEGIPRSSRPGGWLLAVLGAAFLVLILIGAGLRVLSWRMTHFRVTADALELNHGVLSRQHRRARLDRLQAVDVVQPFVARLAGLARLTLEVAGGSDSKITVSYLTESQANALRNHLLARAAGVRYESTEAPEAPEHPVLQVPAPRLVGSLLLSSTTVTVVVGITTLVVLTAQSRSVTPLTAILPAALGTVGVVWRRFNAGFAFRLATSPDGLRLRHGLLEQRAQTVPPGRVQAVGLSQPLLWRSQDWWRVRVNVAGYSDASDHAASTESVLLPVGTREEALLVLALIVPDLGVDAEDPRAVVEAGLVGAGETAGFVTSPKRASWLDPLVWRRTGFRVTREVLLTRGGRLHRWLDVVAHARTQSVGLSQGLLQRRLGLVTFVLHSTPGPVGPQVRHLDAAVAGRLLTEQVERAARARVTAGPERWMEPRGLSSGDPSPA